MAKSKNGSVNRRGFLKGAAASAAAGAAALVTNVETSEAQRGAGRGGGQPAGAAAPAGAAPAPTAAQLARDAGNVQPPAVTARAVTRPGSDLMTQVLKDLNIEYVAANPGSSFEGLQESLINYGNPPNKTPEFITALPGNPTDPAGTRVVVQDSFQTRNQFHGGQLGLAGERNWGRVSLDVRGFLTP